jgi:hypothetical protein
MKRWLTTMTALLLAVTTFLPASAHTGPEARLSFSGDITIGWRQTYPAYDGSGALTGDSPLDEAAGDWYIVAHIDEPFESGRAYSDTTGVEGKPVAQVRNLSFDWDFGTYGLEPSLAAPYILVRFTNGAYAVLSGMRCMRPITGNSTTESWVRSDFTGRREIDGRTCRIWARSWRGTWNAFDATARKTAWKVLAAAKPNLMVDLAIFEFQGEDVFGTFANDPNAWPPGESPSGWTQFNRIDRLAIHQHMWSGPTTVRHCPYESSC